MIAIVIIIAPNCRHVNDRCAEIRNPSRSSTWRAWSAMAMGAHVLTNPALTREWATFCTGFRSKSVRLLSAEATNIFESQRVSLVVVLRVGERKEKEVKSIKECRFTEEFPTISDKNTQPLAACPGFSCRGKFNKCLPIENRCDRVVNCLDAEDEVDCFWQMTDTHWRGRQSDFDNEFVEMEMREMPADRHGTDSTRHCKCSLREIAFFR